MTEFQLENIELNLLLKLLLHSQFTYTLRSKTRCRLATLSNTNSDFFPFMLFSCTGFSDKFTKYSNRVAVYLCCSVAYYVYAKYACYLTK